MTSINGGDEILKNNLQKLRESLAMTQQALADKVEVSRQTIISLENGRYNPSITLAFKLSALFKVPIEEIFIYEGV